MSNYTDYNGTATAAQIDSAVGRALPGGTLETLIADKAPNGFGVGKTGPEISTFINPDVMIRFGVFRGGVAFTTDTISFSYNGTLLVIPPQATDGVVVQHFWPSTSAFGGSTGHITRYSLDGGTTWKPWEWPNPPMQLDVEYRTTERYLGNPVYAKLMIFGLAASGVVDVKHNIENIQAVVSCSGIMTSNGLTIPWYNGRSFVYVSFDGTSVYGYNSSDYGGYTARVVLKYTKTTN